MSTQDLCSTITPDLRGITVVSLEQAVAAPYASSRLADAGARVIKVERPGGDFARRYDRLVKGGSAYFVWLNRGKESIVLDAKRPADVELLRRIVLRADVFIQNLRPGAASRLGVDSATLRQQNGRLITCDISGYGDQGAFAQKKAYDLIVQAEAGLCSITGSADSPARVGVSVCDIAAGMYAHAAILQGLLARKTSGAGRGIKVSLFDSMADWMTVPLLQFQYGAHHTRRNGVNHPSIAPYGSYRCRNGREIVLCVQNDAEWLRFCSIVMKNEIAPRDPRFHDNTARVEHRAELDLLINEHLEQLDWTELSERLDEAEIASGVVNSIDGLMHHPVLRRTVVETPTGPVELVAPAARVEGFEPTLRGVPELGAHTDMIRREFAT
jgi:crotonobetainyl-CoA:carnitine CoA-transferase CaiB-like acyl-CoA transferase